MKPVRIQRGPFQIIAIPVLSDNFVYLICRDGQAVLIDAGEAPPVRRVLEENRLCLRKILVTPRHADHIAALADLQREVVDEAAEAAGPVEVISAPGHTADDVVFYFPEARAVFTGDTLINGACGRPLGGSAEQLFDSLQRIKKLPDETLVFGGHDYLDENLRFGLKMESANKSINDRLRRYHADPAAGLFVPLVEEKKTNPFLRAAGVKEFTALRHAKDRS